MPTKNYWNKREDSSDGEQKIWLVIKSEEEVIINFAESVDMKLFRAFFGKKKSIGKI